MLSRRFILLFSPLSFDAPYSVLICLYCMARRFLRLRNAYPDGLFGSNKKPAGAGIEVYRKPADGNNKRLGLLGRVEYAVGHVLRSGNVGIISRDLMIHVLWGLNIWLGGSAARRMAA